MLFIMHMLIAASQHYETLNGKIAFHGSIAFLFNMANGAIDMLNIK